MWNLHMIFFYFCKQFRVHNLLGSQSVTFYLFHNICLHRLQNKIGKIQKCMVKLQKWNYRNVGYEVHDLGCLVLSCNVACFQLVRRLGGSRFLVFFSLGLTCERRDLTPPSYPLAFICVLWQHTLACTHARPMHACTQGLHSLPHKCNKKEIYIKNSSVLTKVPKGL